MDFTQSYCIYHHSLLNFLFLVYLQVSADDSDPIIALKGTVANYIKEKFSPHLLHKAAIFFHPRRKSLRVLPATDRALVLEYITDQVDSLPLRAHQQQQPQAQPPSAKRRHLLDEFDDLPPQAEDIGEVEKYQQLIVTDTVSDLLLWWKDHSQQYPALAVMARRLLCVMATSAPSERVFSLAGHVVSARRSSLKPSSVNDVLFMNSRLKNL